MNETFEPKTKQKMPIKQSRKFTKIILLLISYVIVALIVWKVTIRMQNSPAYQQQQAQKQLDSIVKKVGQLVVLPQSETPQVAVIQDADALKKSQDFFMDAQNGDKILVYTQAHKAIIYRESTNKIVNIALNVGTDNTAATQKARAAPEPAPEATSTAKATSTKSDR